MIKSKKQMFLVISIFALLLLVGGTTYAFFNYTRTGPENNVATGRIFFNAEQDNTITLSNVFPMTSEQAASDNSVNGTLELHVTGDTTYTDGMEYLITLEDVDLETSSGRNIPVSLLVTVEDGEGNALGTSNANYYTARESKNASIYKIHDTTSISDGDRVMVGYIKAGETGVDEVIKIKAYFDASNILITDTDENEEAPEGYTNGTDTTGKTVFTTTEWNSLSSEGITFKVKAEAREGIWVLPLAGETLLSQMSTKTACTTTSTNNAGIGGSGNVTYFTGAEDSTTEDCLTNYVWYSGKLWRITAIYPDGTMKLVTENPMTAIYWGATQSDVAFDNSYIDQWLNQEFLPTLYNYQNIIVENAEWNVTTTYATTAPYLEANSTTINKTIGLLNAYEYTKGRLGNSSSYLHIGQSWWLMNPYSSAGLRYVNYNGNVNYYRPSGNAYGVRPSIYLKSSVSFTNINETNAGKRSNPYRISGDKAIGTNGQTLNERLSGEYVKLTDSSNNELLYRIVGIENGKTKIVSTSYVENPNSSNSDKTLGYFGTDKFYNTSSSNNTYWDNYLTNTTNGWASTLSSTTRSMLDTGTYYLGYYPNSSNYKSTICATVDANTSTSSCTKISNSTLLYIGTVGLLRIGEMMSNQQSTTTHINSFSSYKSMWLITPFSSSSSYVRNVGNDGNVYYNYASGDAFGARPSIYLKSGVTITGGSGTALDPYSLTLTS